MITMGMWVTVRQLYASGKSIRHISRELGFSRNTVRKAIGSYSAFLSIEGSHIGILCWSRTRERVDEML